ncbi:MAG: WG repeat-containing protein [Rikenellaceae bacterium]|nr:WG repeat-containing protein [Rikenellaceae bacterium]MCL2691812.1 WG repeat-containing protein [Rikenellaceae bacterium]
MAKTVTVANLNNGEIELTPHGIKCRNITALHKKSAGFLITEESLASSRCLLEAIICESKIGYIDKDASIIIEPQYDAVRGDFVLPSSLVCVLKGGK